MDWIDIKQQQPYFGQLIWAKNADGDAILGNATFKPESPCDYLLFPSDNSEKFEFEQWATYDVIY